MIDPRIQESFDQAEKLLKTPKCVGIKLHPPYHGYSLDEYGDEIFSFAASFRTTVLIHPQGFATHILPFACPVPTIKIATNSALAAKKANWIDFNAGVLVEGTTMQETAENFFSYVLEVAYGKKVCSEEAGFHDMAIFKQGVTL